MTIKKRFAPLTEREIHHELAMLHGEDQFPDNLDCEFPEDSHLLALADYESMVRDWCSLSK